jgi:Zn-dependent protease with chaperone function
MPELGVVVPAVSFAYVAAVTGLLAALVGRACIHKIGRHPTIREAAWCAFLPLVAVVLLPLFALFTPPCAPLDSIHAGWHAFEGTMHGVPALHALLHGANTLMLLLALLGVLRAAYLLGRVRSFTAGLRAAVDSEPTWVEGIPVYAIPSPRHLCFALGLSHPAIYVSQLLDDHLTPRDREVMLCHEVAHIRRKDATTRLILAVFFALVPLPGSRRLTQDWERATERACDAEAAVRVGSAADVAAALIRAAQLTARGTAMPGGSCFAADDDDIEGRVLALLAAPGSASRGYPALFILSALLFLQSVSVWVHHLVDLFARH